MNHSPVGRAITLDSQEYLSMRHRTSSIDDRRGSCGPGSSLVAGCDGKCRRDCGQADVEPGLVAAAAGPQATAPAFAEVQSDGRRLQLCRGIQQARPQCREGGHQGIDDHVTGVVARRLWSLWAVLHSHGLAQRRHVPRGRRTRRRRWRPAALRAAQQLARQRQPGQGTAFAVADQAEIRPTDFLGRPDGPDRQRRARVDGFQDLWLRRWTRG